MLTGVQRRAETRGSRLGPYRVYEQLGRGGMCQVFRARHIKSSRDCALKVLLDQHLNNPEILDLFTMEADLSRLLEHPNLIRTYDAGEAEGRPYIAMELIYGTTLGQLLSAMRKQSLRLPPDFALFVISELLEGLHAMHLATGRNGVLLGLIHRDITPQNVFLGFDGRVILGDFGIVMVKAYGGDATPGLLMGKLAYLSPEMVAGDEVNQTADIFTTGLLLYELLTGERAFPIRLHREVLLRRVEEARITRPLKLNPALGVQLEAALLQALSRRPKDRYPNAESFLYALEPYWSPRVANPYSMAAFMAAFNPEASARWRAERRRAKSGLR